MLMTTPAICHLLDFSFCKFGPPNYQLSCPPYLLHFWNYQWIIWLKYLNQGFAFIWANQWLRYPFTTKQRCLRDFERWLGFDLHHHQICLGYLKFCHRDLLIYYCFVVCELVNNLDLMIYSNEIHVSNKSYYEEVIHLKFESDHPQKASHSNLWSPETTIIFWLNPDLSSGG